jgi:hypothetical protein
MRPMANFPDCLRVQKVLSVSINQFRDGARISDRLVDDSKTFPDLGLPNY